MLQTQLVDRLAELDGCQVTAMTCDSSDSLLALGLASGDVHIWRGTDLAQVLRPQQLHAAGAPKDSEVKCVAFGQLQGGAVDLAVVYENGECYTMGLRVGEAAGDMAGLPSSSGAGIERSLMSLGKPAGSQNALLRHCRCASRLCHLCLLPCHCCYECVS